MITKIEIPAFLENNSGKWIQPIHDNLRIDSNLNMYQRVRCIYYEDNNGVIGEKTTDFYRNDESLPDVEKKRRLEQYKDFTFERDTIGTYYDYVANVHVLPDPSTGEAPTGATVVPELEFFQMVPTIEGINTIAGNVYALIQQNIQKIVDKNIKGI